jgi:hypothetical protein
MLLSLATIRTPPTEIHAMARVNSGRGRKGFLSKSHQEPDEHHLNGAHQHVKQNFF